MPSAYSEDVRWMVVYKRIVLGHSACRVQHDLEGLRAGERPKQRHLAAETQDAWVALFLRTGTVTSQQGRREAPPANKVMQLDEVHWLFTQMLQHPTRKLREHANEFELEHGQRVAKSTLCHAARSLLVFRRQRVQHYASERIAEGAEAFWCEVMTYCRAREMLCLDETSKDNRALQEKFGYSVIGCPITVTNVLPLRGESLSALCVLSVYGFEDWRFTPNTYTTALFDYAAKDMLLTPRASYGGRSLIEVFPWVIIDNARIHTSAASTFVDAVRAAGGWVFFLPPYCWHLSPLDNGAFGYVVKYLEANSTRLCRMPLSDALAEAFSALRGKQARECWENCEYLVDW
jgi:hypothetical protein